MTTARDQKLSDHQAMLSGRLIASSFKGGEDEEISRTALSSFLAKEGEIERRKMEVRERVVAQLGRVEEESKRLAMIREELEAMGDPMRKNVVLVRKKIDTLNKELKPLGVTVQKKKLLKVLLLEDQEKEPLYLNKRSRTGRFRVFGTVLKRLKSRRSRIVENGAGVVRANAVMVAAGENGVCDDGDFRVSMSPSSPLRFTLEGSGDGADCESPCFGSPASSPAHNQYQGSQSCVLETTVKFQTELEEEEEEQNSPVSVLDPPHEDEDEREDDRDHEEENSYDSDHQCSYAFVQKEDQRRLKHSDSGMIDTVVKRVCKRLETWPNVDPSTTEMMIRMELGGESRDWRKPPEQITQAVVEIEAEIFSKLVEEIVEDLI